MPRFPFQPDILDALPEELCELFRGLELTLLREICSRLKITDNLNEVTVADIRALRSHGIDLNEIKKAIADATGTGMDKLEALLADVVERNQAYYTSMIDLAHVTAPERLIDEHDVDAIRRQTVGEYRNITQSMGFLVKQGQNKVMLPPARAYQWALDSAELQVMSGAISYNQAIANAVRELAEGGLKTVNYESGHVDSVDVAVRRAVQTGVVQLSSKYREQSVDYLETDLVETTAHSGARDTGTGPANHKSWQGLVFRWSEKPRTSKGNYPDFVKTTGYGTGEGLCGWNCRHNFYPFIEGISERTYTDKELANIDPPPIEFEGKKYTAYEATQMQRRIERTIRKQTRLKAGFEAAGQTDDAAAAGAKLRTLNQKYKSFSKAAGLPEQRERMRALYADDVPRKALRTLEKRSNSGILNDTNYQGIPVTEEAIRQVPKIQPEGWGAKQAQRLQDAHRELLLAVKDKPVGTEAGRVYRLDMSPLSGGIVGEDADQRISLPRFSEPYVAIHSHPSGLTFSKKDIENFIGNFDMTVFTAVGNDGTVYLLQKTEQYNAVGFTMSFGDLYSKLQQAKTPQEYADIVNDFLRKAGKYGTRFIAGGKSIF